jgi:SAM-dependent methyltransferase
VVSLNNVIEHLTDPGKVFAEIARVLKKNGCLIIHTPNSRSYAVQIGRLARLLLPEPIVFRLIRFIEHRDEEDVFPAVYRGNTRKRLIALAEASGMRVERISLLRDRPLFYFLAPVALFELLVSRLMTLIGLEEFAAPVMLGILRPAQYGQDRSAEGELGSARSLLGAGLGNHFPSECSGHRNAPVKDRSNG